MKNSDDFNDFFDGPDIQEVKPEPKKLTPEEIEEIKEKEDTIIVPSQRRRKFLFWAIGICVLILVLAFYFRYLSPSVSDAQKVGYILNVEKRGLIFKTYEGDMISEFAIHDSSKVYQRDFSFTIENDSLAKKAMSLQGTGKKVTVHYERYNGMLPWRGSSRNIIISIN